MKPPDPILVVIILLLLIALWWVKQRKPVRTADQFRAVLNSSQPVLVEVYTDT